MCVGNSQEKTEHNVYVLIQLYILKSVLYFIKYSCTYISIDVVLILFMQNCAYPLTTEKWLTAAKDDIVEKLCFTEANCPIFCNVVQQHLRSDNKRAESGLICLVNLRETGAPSSSRKWYHMEIHSLVVVWLLKYPLYQNNDFIYN